MRGEGVGWENREGDYVDACVCGGRGVGVYGCGTV